MFALRPEDLAGRIIGCGDGPAGFNKRMKDLGFRVVSCDPIYELSKEQIEERILAAKEEVMRQVYLNMDCYVWQWFKTPDELFRVRLETMAEFLQDFEAGKKEGRYLAYRLPDLPFAGREFDLALCSHLLFIYSAHLGYDFHYQSIKEMLRAAAEIRIFPVVDLSGRRSPFLAPVCEALEKEGHMVEIVRVGYEFHRGANEMLRVVGLDSWKRNERLIFG
ncbi:MAG: SAM-dependent methyltransferase [Firmicutes bacterium]|nr:SAM-dependent methyltransferase [Bacillota bacterium]